MGAEYGHAKFQIHASSLYSSRTNPYIVCFTRILFEYVNTHMYTFSPWSKNHIPESYIMFTHGFAYLTDYTKPSWRTKNKSNKNYIFGIKITIET